MSTLDSNSNKAQGLKKAFDEWDAGTPGDSLWNKLNESISSEKVGLKDAFDKWDAGTPSESLWTKLDESISPEKVGLKDAFDKWNVGAPSDSLWTKLDESVATEKVWSKLDDTLKANGSDPDAWLVAAHNEWTTGTNLDGWNKLNEELSRERVWKRLEQTLTIPVTLDVPWFKIAASLLFFFSMSYYMSDGSFTETQPLTSATTISMQQQTANPVSGDVQTTGTNNNVNGTPVFVVDDRDQFAQNNNPQNNDQNVQQNNNDVRNDALANNNSNQQDPNKQDAVTNAANEDVADALLGRKDFAFIDGTVKPGLPNWPVTKYPNWTLSVGTQLSILTEENRSVYTNSLPKFGIAADFAYNKNFGRLRLTEGIGFSQFSQTNGKYINGRHLNTQQKLVAVQLNTTLGYQFDRVTLNGGLVFSRLINGTEQQQNTIVNVYNVSKIQPGLTAGVEYNLRPKTKYLQVAIGAQYQWVPQVATANVVFNDIQGLRFQTKISF